MSATYLLVADLESTGIDLEKDEIIEAAFILVDPELQVELGRWHALLPPTPDGVMRLLGDKKVREMHTANGLLNELALEWPTPSFVDGQPTYAARALERLTSSILRDLGNAGVTEHDTVHLAGSGIGHFDRPMIARHMPGLDEVLHYAAIDVGVPRRMIKMWTGLDISEDNASKTHRAMDDCEGHLNELRAVKKLLHSLPVPE